MSGNGNGETRGTQLEARPQEPQRRQPSTRGNRPYVLESAEYAAQLKSTKADVEAQLGILEGELAGIQHRIADLTRILHSVNAGLVPITDPSETTQHEEDHHESE